MNKVILLLLSVFLFAACDMDKTNQITVASQQAECSGVGLQKCFLIKTGNDQSWQYLYGPIEGFNYEPGYEYIIEVKKKKVQNPAADQSSERYIFVKEITKTKRTSADLPEDAR